MLVETSLMFAVAVSKLHGQLEAMHLPECPWRQVKCPGLLIGPVCTILNYLQRELLCASRGVSKGGAGTHLGQCAQTDSNCIGASVLGRLHRVIGAHLVEDFWLIIDLRAVQLR